MRDDDVAKRTALLAEIERHARQQPRVHAMWLGGSFAFAADDAYSDLDVQLAIDDGAVDEVFEALDRELVAFSPIHTRMRLPEPTWHGFSQCFYRFEDLREEHLLDLCLVEESKLGTFNEIELHGNPVIVFDDKGWVTTAHLDREANTRDIATRLDAIERRHELFGHFTAKELAREDAIAAQYWFGSTLISPLVELLRMQHCPERFHFGLRYLKRDLPDDVRQRLESIVSGESTTLGERANDARAWIRQSIATLRESQH